MSQGLCQHKQICEECKKNSDEFNSFFAFGTLKNVKEKVKLKTALNLAMYTLRLYSEIKIEEGLNMLLSPIAVNTLKEINDLMKEDKND